MRVLRPIVITPDMLLDSSVAEDDFATYNPATPYAQGASCIKAHFIWESVVGSNTGNDPEADDDESHWIKVGPVNRWKMFDQSGGTLSVGAGGIEVLLDPGPINAVGIHDTTAESVTVALLVDDVEVWSATQSTYVSGSAPAGWFGWLFGSRARRKTLKFWNVPSLAGAVVKVTLSGSGEVAVNTVLVGRSLYIGKTQIDPNLDLVDYSKITENDRGVTSVRRGAFANRVEMIALVETRLLQGIRDELIKCRGIPMLWEAEEEGFGVLDTYGIYRKIYANLPVKHLTYVSVSVLSISQN